MSYKILIVDDEPALREMIRAFLAQAGYETVTAGTCAEALAAFRAERPDAVLLDVMLPDGYTAEGHRVTCGDGFSLFRQLRALADVPTLFLSARDEDAARLEGLGLGADDYITKPFLPEELLLRLAAVLRRSYPDSVAGSQCDTLGDITIDWGKSLVRKGREEIPLTAKEYALLRKLWDNRGNIVTIDALCEALWDGPNIGYENTLMVHIRRLRAKIERDPSHPEHLLTVRGLGYRLCREDER